MSNEQLSDQKYFSLSSKFQSAKYSAPRFKKSKKISLLSSKVNSPSCSLAPEDEAPMTIRKVCVEIKSSKVLKNYLAVNKKTKFIKQSSDATAVKAFNPYIKSLKPQLYFGRKVVAISEDSGKTQRTGLLEGNNDPAKRKKDKKKKRNERPLSALSGCSKWTVGSASKEKSRGIAKYSRNPVLKENDSNGLSENSMTKYVRERIHQAPSPARD